MFIVSGIMVYMCMKELTPQALKYLDSKVKSKRRM